MGRSRLPLPSLLGALLMLSPELLLGIPEDFSDLPANDPGVKKALAFVVERYNQERKDSTSYFKVLRVLKAQSQANSRDEYRLTVDFVKTRCKKSRKMKYKGIQKCKLLQGNPEKPNCYLELYPALHHPNGSWHSQPASDLDLRRPSSAKDAECVHQPSNLRCASWVQSKLCFF